MPILVRNVSIHRKIKFRPESNILISEIFFLSAAYDKIVIEEFMQDFQTYATTFIHKIPVFHNSKRYLKI